MAEASELIAQVARRLRAQGERMTEPRAAVLRALAGTPGHLRMDEIAEAVAVTNPGVHRASVYRTVAALGELGLVQHVHLGHGATAYHLVPEVGPHPHAECHECGRVLDLPANTLADVATRLRHDFGFSLDGTHVALSGRCAECRRGTPGERG